MKCQDCDNKADRARFFPTRGGRLYHALYCGRCAQKYPLMCQRETHEIGLFGALWRIVKGVFE